MVQYELSLCIGEKNTDRGVTIKCHDEGISLLIHLNVCKQVSKWRTEEEAFVPPAGAKPVLKISKPDNKKCTIDGRVEGAAVVFKLPPQACTVAGTSSAEVSVYGAVEGRATTATFPINVPEECVCNCEMESEPYIDLVGEQIKEAKAAEAGAKEAAKTAMQAQVNTPKIGENGNWFVWDTTKREYIDTNVKASGGITASITAEDERLDVAVNLDTLDADIVGKVDANKNIKLTKKTLPDGVYTFAYDDIDANETVIGTITIARNV